MELYSQRNGMRKPKETTYDISCEAYRLLLNCCEKYYSNLAWKYPSICYSCHSIQSVDHELLDTALKYEIPDLFRKDGCIVAPSSSFNVFERKTIYDEYNQFALLDLIEYIANNCRSYREFFERDCEHTILSFQETNSAFNSFQKEINEIFNLFGLLYKLNRKKEIERIVQNSLLTKEIEASIATIEEDETRKLLQEAIDKHRSHDPDAPRDAAEKIWDAYERLRTYYCADKKKSVEKLLSDISGSNDKLKELLNSEFLELGNIGNNYRIRHHETNRIDITDNRHYDYFFNRCLSLIALAIQYLN